MAPSSRSPNTGFWLDEAEYGQIEHRFTHDYKGPAAWELAATEILIAVHQPGAHGDRIGWKAWEMPIRTFDTFFDSIDNFTQTTAIIGEDTADVYAYEPLIKNGTPPADQPQHQPQRGSGSAGGRCVPDPGRRQPARRPH